jgi:hypothetical protein
MNSNHANSTPRQTQSIHCLRKEGPNRTVAFPLNHACATINSSRHNIYLTITRLFFLYELYVVQKSYNKDTHFATVFIA